MEEAFLKRNRGGGILPTIAYTERLHPKGISYLGFSYIKEWGIYYLKYMKG